MATTSIVKSYKWFTTKSKKGSQCTKLPLCMGFGKELCSKSKSPSPPSSPPIMPKIDSREGMNRQVFRYFDNDNDGKISIEELRAYFMSFGESMSHDEAQKVIKEFDIDGDNMLEFNEFVRLIEQDNKDDDDDDLRKAFEMFEVDKGSGCITPRGLQQVLNRLGDVKSYEECEAMIQKFDLDGNGVLDFNEFQQMMS